MFAIASRTLLSLAILAAGIGAFVWLGKVEQPTRPAPKPLPPAVTVCRAEEHRDGLEFEVDGVVVPFRTVNVAAQVAGRVQYKAPNCRSGRAVRKGEVLLRIDPTDYEIAVRQLTEELRQAAAQINELNTEIATTENQIETSRRQFELEQRQTERLRDLIRRSAASQSELDIAKRTELSAQTQLQQLQDQKRLLISRRSRLESVEALGRANLEQAEVSLARCEVRSPLDGVVVTDDVEQDGYIQTGATMLVLQDTSRLDVTCKLHARQMNWLWQSLDEQAPTADDERFVSEVREPTGDDDATSHAYKFPVTPATIRYELGTTTYQWSGIADRYDGAGIDQQTRMVPCRIHVDDPLAVQNVIDANSLGSIDQVNNPPTLMTGMFVKVEIQANPPIPLVKLPQTAIRPGNTVWVVEDEKLVRKEVKIATSMPDHVIVNVEPDGLQIDDRVVSSPLATPFEGMEVFTGDPAERERQLAAGRANNGWAAKGGGRPRGARPADREESSAATGAPADDEPGSNPSDKEEA